MKNISLEDFATKTHTIQLDFNSIGITGFKKLSMTINIASPTYYYEVSYRLVHQDNAKKSFIDLKSAIEFYNSLGV